MEAISVTKFKAQALNIIREVHDHRESCVLTKHGKPYAMVVPIQPPEDEKLVLGRLAGTIKHMGDVVSPVVDEGDWEACK